MLLIPKFYFSRAYFPVGGKAPACILNYFVKFVLVGLILETLGDLDAFLLYYILGLVCPLLGACKFLGSDTCLSLNLRFCWNPYISVLFMAALWEIAGIEDIAA